MNIGTFDSDDPFIPAVFAVGTNGAPGVWGESDDGTGVAGHSDLAEGVWGTSSAHAGVLGESYDGTGVFGESETSIGVLGVSHSAEGLWGHSFSSTGVRGQSDHDIGIWGIGFNLGVLGQSDTGIGVHGESHSYTGVMGQSDTGIGVMGESYSGTGVFGRSGGRAGEFFGDVEVVGALLKPGGGFQIDHPLDPAHKSLSHSFVESSDMKNLYDGVVVLDANGEAEVTLPPWFETLNSEFRYQLTPIGASAPELYIAKKIQDNRFRIAGGKPAMEVSWQVTGIRQDVWAKAHRIPVEQDKPAHEQGYYWHPDLHGEPEEKSLLRVRHPELKSPVLPEQ